MTKTLNVRGFRVRSQSQRRYIVVTLVRSFDGVRYGDFIRAEIWRRSDDAARLQRLISHHGFHSSVVRVIMDTVTGDEVA